MARPGLCGNLSDNDDMANTLPTFDELLNPLIRALHALGGSGSIQELYDKVVELEPWGAGNAVEAIGIAPTDTKAAQALGFPRPERFYGASDSRAPAGSAARAAATAPAPSPRHRHRRG